jgi:nucleoside-diphosphate-sugar epimerase
MKIALIGGTGFIGSHLAQALMSDHEVYVLSRDKAKSKHHYLWDSDYVNFPMTTEQAITSIEFLSLMDAIVPLAAKLGHVECMKDPMGSLQAAPMIVLTILETIKQLDEKPLIVYPSSHTAHKPGTSPYSAHKVLVEHYLKMYGRAWGVPSTVLRFGTMYGPGQVRPSIVNFYVARGLVGETLPIFKGRGHDRLALTYIEDGIYAYKEAIEGRIPTTLKRGPHDVVGHCNTLLEIATAVSELVGGKVQLDAPCSPLAEATNPGDSPVGCQLGRYCEWKPIGLREGILKTKEWLDERVP